MIQDLEKAKKILGKTFCFMEWQADEARKRGEEIMNGEDIEFILSLDPLADQEVMSFDVGSTYNGSYDSKKLFSAIDDASYIGLKGIMPWVYLIEEDRRTVEKRGYFLIEHYECSGSWHDIYFSEEFFIEAKISTLQHQFGCIASVASMI